MPLRLGIDIACRAAHQASLADKQGRFLWSGRRFRTIPSEIAQLWAMLPAGTDPGDVLVVMEPTRNAWVPLAAWFRRQGARVVLVPPERSADLRNYYAKHAKSDRLDSQLLARLPMLYPDGLHLEDGLGPGDALKRAAKLHSTLVHRRSQSLARLDTLLEILGPAWHAAIGTDLANRTVLKFLAAGYADPHVVKRLGRARLARFCYRHSRGAWGEPHADALLEAARQTLELWVGGELDYPDLAEDIAIEARLALQLTEEIKDLDERSALLVKAADPNAILTSAPGVATITAAAILGRLGDPNRFSSLAGARAFTGLVPILDSSGVTGRHGGPTKRGDAVLRQALFMAAGQARRIDPALAAKYHRLMVEAGKHHNSALCHIATTLLTRIIACWRSGQPYKLRDVDGHPVTAQIARLRGARPPGPAPRPQSRPVVMQRRASNTDVICVTLQKVALGRVHARKTVTVEVTQEQLRIHCDDGIRTVTRTNDKPITRIKAPRPHMSGNHVKESASPWPAREPAAHHNATMHKNIVDMATHTRV